MVFGFQKGWGILWPV